MMQPKYYAGHVLEARVADNALWRLGDCREAESRDGHAAFVSPLIRQRELDVDKDLFENGDTDGVCHVQIACYGDAIVRMMVSRDKRPFPDDSPMLDIDRSLQKKACVLEEDERGWRVTVDGQPRLTQRRGARLAPEVLPDGKVRIAFQTEDHCNETFSDALPFALLRREDGTNWIGFALSIEHDEHFCGTGERFDRMDLFGRQIDLVNEDTRGVSTSRAYKNVPFLMSSRRYGVFVHSSAKMRLDIGCHSNQSLQWFAEDDALDVFFIGGDSFERILYNYRRLTGFPPMPPVWSFGAWMSRMTYWSADEVLHVADRLRAEGYPMDVLHVDTAWFPENWRCDWKFSKERFPDPPGYFAKLREKGFRGSLWQWPYLCHGTDLAEEGRTRGYVGRKNGASWGPAVYPLPAADTLDLTNPEAVAWYKGLLRHVLEQGTAAIKADFGERVDEDAEYDGIDGRKYRNLFSLLYQRAVWEVTQEVRGEAVIWARAGWAGCQRYPVHWGGDCASSYEGLAASLWGGMHLGLSGFAFWSHDVGGFYGVDEFLGTKPSEDLYARWVQAGVFSSHMRFHGTGPREPWEYPGVADTVRDWLRFRYALLPYILAESEKCCRTGLPMLRSMAIEWPDDPAVWSISDQYLFGDAFLVCPVLSANAARAVYLPEDKWVDFWTGDVLEGPQGLGRQSFPLPRMPLYVRYGASVEFAEPVLSTDDLDEAERFHIQFDDGYPGAGATRLGGILR